jgi:hypothetical protein
VLFVGNSVIFFFKMFEILSDQLFAVAARFTFRPDLPVQIPAFQNFSIRFGGKKFRRRGVRGGT